MNEMDLRRKTIPLPPRLDLAAAELLLSDLRSMATGGIVTTLDASRVEAASYAALQVILSWARTQPDATVLRPSETFLATLNELGLDGAIVFADEAPRVEADREDAPDDRPRETLDTAPELPAETVPSLAEDLEPAPTSLKRILTIDDSKTMRDMLRLTLARSGFDVLQAVDGCDGLDVLSRETVDVIITDINMPRMDGYGVIENLRRDTKYDSTPILVLTTENDREKKDRARDLGATGFIVKPFDPSKLVDVIYKVSP